jgi:hypothetical protein
MTKNKHAFAEEVTALIQRNITDRSERMAAINALTDEYDRADMDVTQLERLTDHIFREELTDTYRGKSICVEYPFLSERQLTTRRNGEVGAKIAEDYGTDRRNYSVPKRRLRNSYENNYVDTHAKSRNKARAAQYKRDTSSSDVVPYNLRDTSGELAPEFVACRGLGERWKNGLGFVN